MEKRSPEVQGVQHLGTVFQMFVFIIKSPRMGELITWDKEQADILNTRFASVLTSK